MLLSGDMGPLGLGSTDLTGETGRAPRTPIDSLCEDVRWALDEIEELLDQARRTRDLDVARASHDEALLRAQALAVASDELMRRLAQPEARA
jgi:hypothetical protein